MYKNRKSKLINVFKYKISVYIMQKKGELSRLAIGLLICSLIIVLTLVIWIILRGGKENQNTYDDSNLDLKISQVKKTNDNNLDVTVKRNSGEGEFVGLSFEVSDGSTTEIIKVDGSIPENQENVFSLKFISLNASKIEKISVTPIFENKKGEEVLGSVKDEYLSPVCSPSCPYGAQCGNNGCGGKCGSGCSSGYLCVNYKCIKQQTTSGGSSDRSSGSESSNDGANNDDENETVCTPTTCLALSRTCGTVSDGCGGTLNCGTCETGYSCQVNGTCIKDVVIDCGEVNCANGEYCFNGVCLLNVTGNTYFVAVDGNDNNPGTFEQPFLSWGKSFKTAQAGDIVYFRGGVYYSDKNNVGGERDFNKGSKENYIRFFNYPNEIPILDCSLHNTSISYYNKGIAMWNTEYIHMKGLHITNVYQGRVNVNVEGISAWRVGNIIFEELVVSNVDGEGFIISNYSDTILIKNCDSYNLNDALRTAIYPEPGSAGQNGAGFQYNNGAQYGEAAINSRIYFQGCRTWNFSDNGFAGLSVGYAEFDSCWAFDGGMLSGEGCGFKYASLYGGDENNLALARVIKNSIGAFNGGYGFSPNNRGNAPLNGHYFNNFAYHNGYKGTGHGLGHGFVILDYNGITPAPNEMYKNNLAYDNELGEIYEGDNYIHEYNSWDLPVSLNDEDFVSLDMSQLMSPRKADGSLPDITFGHLRQGSDLVDAGMIMPGYHCSTAGEHPSEDCVRWYGAAPDLGAFESNY